MPAQNIQKAMAKIRPYRPRVFESKADSTGDRIKLLIVNIKPTKIARGTDKLPNAICLMFTEPQLIAWIKELNPTVIP